MNGTIRLANMRHNVRTIGFALSMSSAWAIPAKGQEAIAELYSLQQDLVESEEFRSPTASKDSNPGWQIGKIIVRPFISAAVENNSNVRADGSGQSDVSGAISPELRFERASGRQRIDGEFRASVIRHASAQTEDNQTYQGVIRYRSYGRSGSGFLLNAMGGRYLEERNDIQALSDAADPVQYMSFKVRSATVMRRGRLLVSPGIRLEGRKFDANTIENGSSIPLDLSYRNVVRYGPSLLAGYSFSPTTLMYLGGEIQRRDYSSLSASERDGSEKLAYIGVRWQPSSLTRLHVSVGQQRREYPSLGYTISKTYYNGALEWSPNRQTLLTLSGSRDLTDIATLQSETGINSQFKLSLERSLRHNLQLKALARTDKIRINQTGQEFSRDQLGASIEYGATRRSRYLVSFEYIRGKFFERISIARPDFTQFRIKSGVSITL